MMGRVVVKLKGSTDDMKSLYEHLIYHVKKISSVPLTDFLSKEEIEFTVTV